MTENIIGTYQCKECDTEFKIIHSSVASAHEGWEPTCPICGVHNYTEEVE